MRNTGNALMSAGAIIAIIGFFGFAILQGGGAGTSDLFAPGLLNSCFVGGILLIVGTCLKLFSTSSENDEN